MRMCVYACVYLCVLDNTLAKITMNHECNLRIIHQGTYSIEVIFLLRAVT